MRYSFHGKVRATGQQVDGFVEAANATQAIDRLADQGIIGVYTVRPEAKVPKNAVQLAGQEAVDEVTPPSQRPRLEQRSSRSKPIPAVAGPSRSQTPAAPASLPPPAPAPAPVQPVQAVLSGSAEAMLTQLDQKLTTLLGHVEKILSRPQQVIYQSGPVRGGGGGSGGRKSSRIPSDVQNNTLRDIFQNNLDLRQSLEKLASTVNPAPKVAPKANGEMVPLREARESISPSLDGNDEGFANGHELADDKQSTTEVEPVGEVETIV